MRDDSLGIYCVRQKKFYYLESGKIYVANTVDRLKKALIKRGYIEFTDKSFLDTEAYKVMTCRDAQLEGYESIPIYISNHVKQSLATINEEKTSNKSWG